MRSARSGDVRRHFNYSNVMSTLAVFLVVAGGTAMAAAVNNSGDIAKQAVKNSDVKKETLQANRLKDGAAVGSAEVIDNSLTGTDVNESTLNISQPSSLPPSGPAGGGLTGEYPNPTIANDAVGSAQVQPDSLAAGDLAPNSANTSEIADNAVNSAKVAADTLTQDDLAATSVRSSELTGTVSDVTTDSIAATTDEDVTATCPAGTQAISGGYFTPASGVVIVTRMRRNADNAWVFTFRNNAATAQGVDAHVTCLAN